VQVQCACDGTDSKLRTVSFFQFLFKGACHVYYTVHMYLYIVVVICFGFVGWFYFDERCNGRDVFLCRRSGRKLSAHVSLVGK
jgi:hypothetical protein